MGKQRAGAVETESMHSGSPSPWLRIASAASRLRPDLPMAIVDACIVVVVYTSLLLLRFELEVPSHYWRRFGIFLVIALVVHLIANRLWAPTVRCGGMPACEKPARC